MAGPVQRVDVRGLPPCEPMEQILAACDALSPGASIHALVSREPRPLYPLLQQRGLAWQVLALGEDGCELLIRRADPA
jgi:uncharacterized protein (DUF2249 family)